MFLIGNILRNLTTALEFHWLKWLLTYGSKHGKLWFSHIKQTNIYHSLVKRRITTGWQKDTYKLVSSATKGNNTLLNLSSVCHGYWLTDKWISLNTSHQRWTNVTDILKCLHHKRLLLLGDSTTRQWTENIAKSLKSKFDSRFSIPSASYSWCSSPF